MDGHQASNKNDMRRIARFGFFARAASIGGLLVAALASRVFGAESGTSAVEIALDAIKRIELHPPEARLVGPRSRMQIVVTGFDAAGNAFDLTRVAQFRSTNSAVAVAESGIVRSVADGAATVSVKVAQLESAIPLEVASHAAPHAVSFRHEVLASLTKHGCNSGACHGSPSGKGGFRLSLRAYDEALDMETLVRESFNRRTNIYKPETSLLLRKPLMEVSHGGGRRLATTDSAYQLLRDWVAQGCRAEAVDAPLCKQIQVYPRQRDYRQPARSQQLLVLAHFSDGSVRDVTALTCYSSSDVAAATVDEHGLVEAKGRGEAAILVRYLELAETSLLTFLEDRPGFVWNDPPRENFVDDAVFEKLRHLQILPSDPCDDHEFLRRVYLDVIGKLPTFAELEAFLADRSPDRRARLIDSLLERPEFATFWAQRWGDLLRLRNSKLNVSGVHKFHRWLVSAFRDNMPYDSFAEELLTAEGSTFENPPANFFRAASETNDCTETVGQLFLGVRIQCAKCHNHPFERWTQDNYYGLGAFFDRVRRKAGSVPDEQVIWVARSGELTQPRTGKPMSPWLPVKGELELDGEDDRRHMFVHWLTSRENQFFAKVEVNRNWGYLMGRGMVEPVDDFRDSNPPSNAALLDRLAEDFIAHGYDRKHTIRTILNSRTYQLSSRTNEINRHDDKYFSHALPRLLRAEQLLDAICQVTDVYEKYDGLPSGVMATELPSPDFDKYFLKAFGQPPRETACQCERLSDPNLQQALQLINGPLVNDKIRNGKNRISKLLAAGNSDREIVSKLYLLALCRHPTQLEREVATDHLSAQSDRLRSLEDICWAIFNSDEFLFQH